MTLSPLTKLKMLQARTEVRKALAIRPDAPSQIVVNALLQFAWAWQSGNQPAAMHALAAPVFTLPPPQTLQVLNNLPYIPTANYATADLASHQLLGGDKDLP